MSACYVIWLDGHRAVSSPEVIPADLLAMIERDIEERDVLERKWDRKRRRRRS
jgi:hypothetical protein